MFSQAASLPTQPRVHFKVREHASLITILGMRRAKRREHEPETRSSRSGSGLLLKILGPCSHLVPLINHALPPSFLALGYEVTWNHTRPKLSRGVPVQQFARRPPTPIGAFCGRCQQSLLLPISVPGVWDLRLGTLKPTLEGILSWCLKEQRGSWLRTAEYCTMDRMSRRSAHTRSRKFACNEARVLVRAAGKPHCYFVLNRCGTQGPDLKMCMSTRKACVMGGMDIVVA